MSKRSYSGLTKSDDILTTCLVSAQKCILSVGSGDGSQQAAIVRQGVVNIVVTFYDTRSQLLKKYPHANNTLDFLEKHCRYPLRFGVDATKLYTSNKNNNNINGFEKEQFDLIFFTFPHTGISNNDPRSVSTNQELLRGFLKSASQILKPDGEVQITLKNGELYQKWNIASLLENGAYLLLKSTNEFDKSLFPAYKHRLTNGMAGEMKEVPEKQGAKVYIFGCNSNGSSTQSTTTCCSVKNLTILALEEVQRSWSDEELRAMVVTILERFDSPTDVLEIRRNIDPTPDTRQLNRVLYEMEKQKIITKYPPDLNRNKKPRWKLT